MAQEQDPEVWNTIWIYTCMPCTNNLIARLAVMCPAGNMPWAFLCSESSSYRWLEDWLSKYYILNCIFILAEWDEFNILMWFIMLRLSHTVEVVKAACSLSRGDVIMFIKTVCGLPQLFTARKTKKPQSQVIQPDCKLQHTKTVAETVTSDSTFCHFRAAKVLFLGKESKCFLYFYS